MAAFQRGRPQRRGTLSGYRLAGLMSRFVQASRQRFLLCLSKPGLRRKLRLRLFCLTPRFLPLTLRGSRTGFPPGRLERPAKQTPQCGHAAQADADNPLANNGRRSDTRANTPGRNLNNFQMLRLPGVHGLALFLN